MAVRLDLPLRRFSKTLHHLSTNASAYKSDPASAAKKQEENRRNAYTTCLIETERRVDAS
jgi:hypothetical protein